MAEPEQPLAVKVGTVALTLVAGWVAQKAIGKAWEKSTGRAVPTNLHDDEIPAVQAIVFAAVSGGVAVLARRLAHRGAGRAVARFFAK